MSTETLTDRDEVLLLDWFQGEAVRDRFTRFAGAVACSKWAMDCAEESSVEHLTFALWRHLKEKGRDGDDFLIDRFTELVVHGDSPLTALLIALAQTPTNSQENK